MLANFSLLVWLAGPPNGTAVWADVLAGVVLILGLGIAAWALTRDE